MTTEPFTVSAWTLFITRLWAWILAPFVRWERVDRGARAFFLRVHLLVLETEPERWLAGIALPQIFPDPMGLSVALPSERLAKHVALVLAVGVWRERRRGRV
jgi:hypothetical protein